MQRAFVLLIVALLAFNSVTAVPAAEEAAYIVGDIGLSDAEAVGAAILDSYPAFFTALLTASEADMLVIQGATVQEIDYSIERGLLAESDAVPDDLRAASNSGHFIVQFRGPVKMEWLAWLQEKGARAYDTLPHHAYVVKATEATRSGLAASPVVHRIVPYHPAYKLSPQLGDSGTTKVSIYLHPDAEIDAVASRLSSFASVERTVSSGPDRIIFAYLPLDEKKSVARWEEVSWLERAYTEGSPAMDKASSIVQSGATGPYNYVVHTKAINGSSQVGMVCDNGLPVHRDTSYTSAIVTSMGHEVIQDPNGIKLEYNRHLASSPLPLGSHSKMVLYYSPQEPDGTNRGSWYDDGTASHGLRVVDAMAGNKGADDIRDAYDGVAFRARVAYCDVMNETGDWQILDELWRYYAPGFGAGANVTSLSGGATPMTNIYDGRARQQDFIVWNHTNFTMVQAVGNIVDTGEPGETPPETCSRTMKPEATAKNVITVGGTFGKAGNQSTDPFDGDNAENVSIGSCQGPTADGRIKPNVVAPGFCVTTAIAGGYGCMSGTSYATPIVAGSALLIRDYFRKGFYPTGAQVAADERANVSAALVRALLQVGAKEISGDFGDLTYPNPVQGWGRILLDNALYFAGDTDKLLIVDEWDAVNLTTGQVWERDFVVNSNRVVRVMLTWSDYPGTPTGTNAKVLVNDLHLRIKGPPSGGVNATYIGNHFTPTVLNSAVPTETAEGQFLADGHNAEEGVIICNNNVLMGTCSVTAGTYTLRVLANETRAEGQRFAAAIVGDVSWA